MTHPIPDKETTAIFKKLTDRVEEATKEESEEIFELLSKLSEDDLTISSVKRVAINPEGK